MKKKIVSIEVCGDISNFLQEITREWATKTAPEHRNQSLCVFIEWAREIGLDFESFAMVDGYHRWNDIQKPSRLFFIDVNTFADRSSKRKITTQFESLGHSFPEIANRTDTHQKKKHHTSFSWYGIPWHSNPSKSASSSACSRTINSHTCKTTQQGKVIQNQPHNNNTDVDDKKNNNNDEPGGGYSYDKDFPNQFLFGFQGTLHQQYFYFIVLPILLLCSVSTFCVRFFVLSLMSIDLWMIATTTVDSVGELHAGICQKKLSFMV